jgi:hypothetical protein
MSAFGVAIFLNHQTLHIEVEVFKASFNDLDSLRCAAFLPLTDCGILSVQRLACFLSVGYGFLLSPSHTLVVNLTCRKYVGNLCIVFGKTLKVFFCIFPVEVLPGSIFWPL